MKTVEDLNTLIPYITNMILSKGIAESSYEEDDDEDGRYLVERPGFNSVVYDHDGWFIEVTFYSFEDGHIEIDDANVCYEDPETGEGIDFEGPELSELFRAIENL